MNVVVSVVSSVVVSVVINKVVVCIWYLLPFHNEIKHSYNRK